MNRRRFLELGAVGLVVGAAGCSGDGADGTSGGDGDGTDSEGSDGDGGGTGDDSDETASESNGTTDDASGAVEVAWTADLLGSGTLSAAEFLVDGDRAYLATAAGVLGLDAATGERLWAFEGAGGDRPPALAVHDAAGVVALSDSSELVALAPAAGDVRWRRELGTVGFGLLDATDDYVVAGGSNGLEAVDPENGETATRDRAFGFRFPERMTALPGAVVVSDAEGTLGRYDVESGEAEWTTGDVSPTGAPRTVDETVVAPSSGAVAGVDASDGSVAFRTEVQDGAGPLAPAGSTVVFRDGDRDGAVRSVAVPDGDLAWERTGIDVATGPGVVGDDRAVVAVSGFVHVLDLANGDLVTERVQPVDDDPAAFVALAGTADLALGATRNQVLGLSV